LKITLKQIKKIIREEIINEKKRMKALSESITEGPDYDMFKALNKVNNDVFRIMNKYDGKVDMDAIFRSWMLGLHANLKKAGIKLK